MVAALVLQYPAGSLPNSLHERDATGEPDGDPDTCSSLRSSKGAPAHGWPDSVVLLVLFRMRATKCCRFRLTCQWSDGEEVENELRACS
jgi:hypothetical protein